VILDGVDDVIEVKTASGCLEECATDVVPMVNEFGVEGEWLGGVKPSVPSGDAHNMTDAIEVPQTHDELSDDGVKAGAETAAGDNGDADMRRVEADVLAGTGAVVGEAGQGRGVVFDLAEYEVGVSKVEAMLLQLGGVKVGVVIERVGACLEVWNIIAEARHFFEVYGFEQLGYV